jgi:hypothetical protein
MSLANWKSPSKRTYEDGLFLEYWQALGGLIFAEVPVGRDGHGVRIVPPESEKTPSDIVAFSRGRDAKRFEELATGAEVEVLEVKRSLDRYVLGQVIIGADLLEMEYAPSKIDQVVICNQDDPVLKRVCDKRGIRVWMPPKL